MQIVHQVGYESLPTPCLNSEERYTGHRILWLKVIVRAMFDWASYKDSNRLSQRKVAESAHNWLFNSNVTFNSFENICKLLEIDPRKIRARAAVMSKEDVAKIEFKERSGTLAPHELEDGHEDDFDTEEF